MLVFKPQKGFQQNFTSTMADIAIGGGAAGVGKTYSLLYFPLVAMDIPNFFSVIFRREFKQVSISGGLWDESKAIYMQLPDAPNIKEQQKAIVWQSGAKLSFDHIQYESDVYKYQGMQAAYIGFDELTHFTSPMFWYLVSRNRSMAFDSPFVRATTNPEGEGWIKDLISWYLYPSNYIDQSLADYPNPDRVGKLRYFRRVSDAMIWGDSVDEVCDLMPEDSRDRSLVKSFTFINGTLDENKILNEANPGYRASLEAQDENERIKLLGGRWRNANDEQMKLFDRASVLDLQDNTHVNATGKRYITCDVALEGADEMVIFVWDEWTVIDVYVIPKSDGQQVVNIIEQVKNKWNVPNRQIIIDADGVGGFLKGYIRGAYQFHGNGAVIKVNGEKEAYQNLRAQCYYYAAKKVNDSDAYYSKGLPYYDKLAFELNAIKKTRTNLGLFAVEGKDLLKARIGRSPNFADAFMMRSALSLSQVTGSYAGQNM